MFLAPPLVGEVFVLSPRACGILFPLFCPLVLLQKFFIERIYLLWSRSSRDLLFMTFPNCFDTFLRIICCLVVSARIFGVIVSLNSAYSVLFI